jgi:hypothetical protein
MDFVLMPAIIAKGDSVSSQSGFLAMAESSTGTSALWRIKFRLARIKSVSRWNQFEVAIRSFRR